MLSDKRDTGWAESDDALLRAYLREVTSVPLLSAEQEVSLAKRAQRADRQAKDDLVRANLRLVIAIARRYQHQGLALMDLIQEGNLGLLRAVEKYDYRRGYRFTTYAKWWIRHGVTRALSDHGRAIRISSRTGEVMRKLLKVHRRLVQELCREPLVEEIAAVMQLPASRVRELQLLLLDTESLDQPVDSDESSCLGDCVLDDSLNDISDMIHDTFERERLGRLLAELTVFERGVVALRFGLHDDRPRTFREIGAELGCSGEHARCVNTSTLEKLATDCVEQGARAPWLLPMSTKSNPPTSP